MRASIKTLLGLFASVLLTSCGGGGGSSNNSGFNPPGLVVTVTAQTSSTTSNSLVGVTVRVTNPNGPPLADGTVVNLLVTPTGAGLVSAVLPAGTPIVLGERVTNTTVGGLASFRFHSRAGGTATLTASVPDPNAPARSVTGTTTITVGGGAPSDPRITLVATRTTLPPNTLGVPPFFGSPFISDVTVTCRRLDGSLVPDGTVLGVSVTPFQDPLNGFSTPDLASTPVNEFTQILNTGPVTITGGRATIFVHSSRNLASFNLTVTCVDPSTGETVSSTLQFNTQQISLPLPSSVTVSPVGPVYIQGSGGQSSTVIVATVRDAGGLLIPDAPAGVNNVRFEIVGGAQAGERLTGINAAGAAVNGGTIDVRTVNGVATVSYQAGTREGVVTIRITSDRADNNVDNGIQDPVFATRGLTVSDGRLFDLQLTVPPQGAIAINPPRAPGEVGVVVTLPGGGTITIPVRPDGTYSLTVSALATDRQGNPVIPGTEIRFGLIDFPLVNNFFAIAGNDGNPQEGGTLFTAPTGAFTTAGGGAGPGDTLIVFGEESTGNRDLESARTVQSVNGSTSLTVQRRFNFNDDTGVSVNNGPVLPYVIGRATNANITQSAVTNAIGVATTQLNYPVSSLGRLSVVWAQGSGDIVAGTAELITDAEFVVYPGVAPAQLTATPSVIPGNRTADVNVCLTDALGSGISGISIAFNFEGLTGPGSVDGTPTSGFVTPLTGTDGCTIASVTTSGVTPPGTGGSPPRVVFSVGGLSDSVDIVVGQLILQAIPSGFVGDGIATITLRLLDGAGNPVPGVQLTGTCQASTGGLLTIVTPPGVTDANGTTTTRVQASGFSTTGTTPPTGTCTFTTPTGSPSAVVTWTGFDQCSVAVSPLPPACPGSTPTGGSVSVGFAPTSTAGTVTSNPAGISCATVSGGTATGQCSVTLTANGSIILNATPVAGGVFCSWTGAGCSGTSSTIQVPLNAGANVVCQARFALAPLPCPP